MNRRDFIRTAGGAAGATAVAASAGPAAAAEEGGGEGEVEPDYGGWLDDVDNYDSTVDERGSDEVTIEVGAGSEGLHFDPPAVWIDPGTTVVWEWTGEGGSHNVNAQEGADFTSETTSEDGHTFEQTLEEGGIVTYQCDPHVDLGMKGALAVGDDVPTVEVGAGGGGCTQDDLHACGVPIQAHFVGLATLLMIVVSAIFTFFMLKYGESPHASGGD